MQIKQAIEKDISIQVLHTWGTLRFGADDSNSKRHKEEECAGMVLSYIHSPCPQGRVVAFLHVFKDLVPTLVLALRLETTELLRKKK